MIRIFYVKPMCLLGFLIAALTLPTWAHHSHNAYEVTVWEDIEGTVSEVHLINPHSWLYLNVTDENGETPTSARERFKEAPRANPYSDEPLQFAPRLAHGGETKED